MGLFSGVGKFFKKAGKFVEDEIIEPVAKDAIPAAAAYFTGGQSLKFVPPSDSGAFSRIIEGVGGSTGASDVQSPMAPRPKPKPVTTRVAANRSQLEVKGIKPAIPIRPEAMKTNYLQDLMGLLQAPQNKSDISNSPQVGNNSPQVVNSSQSMDQGTIILIGLSAASLIAMFMIARGK
jgi:hypothetical protein